jgi:hypothetical protein
MGKAPPLAIAQSAIAKGDRTIGICANLSPTFSRYAKSRALNGIDMPHQADILCKYKYFLNPINT